MTNATADKLLKIADDAHGISRALLALQTSVEWQPTASQNRTIAKQTERLDQVQTALTFLARTLALAPCEDADD